MKDSSTLKTMVRRFWDARPCGTINTAAPPGSDAFYAGVEAHRYAEEFHIPLVAEFTEHSGECVLEIGGGLGTDGRRFARGGARYTDCDLSIESLMLARRGFQLASLPGAFTCGDAEHLPFPDASFDVVYSHGVLHHVPDTRATIREVHRVLRPGGKAIIMLYAREAFAYVVGAQTLGRLRLEITRRRLGASAFNDLVGLPPEHRGWLPDWVVVNNSTDGVGNPLSQLFTRGELLAMFADFKDVRTEKHYFPRRKIPLIGPRLPRPVATWLGNTMGSFWYVKAVR